MLRTRTEDICDARICILVAGLALLSCTSGCGNMETEMTESSGLGQVLPDELKAADGVDPQIVDALVSAGVAAEKIQPTFVYASASNVTDEHMKMFAKMPELKTLSLGKTGITGSGLSDLNCPKLRGLLLFETQVTDASVGHIPALPSLESLSLAGTAIDGSCLEHVATYSTLTALELQSTKVNDASLSPLRRLKALSRLELKNTAVSDLGLQFLQDCPELYTLDLSGTQVSDEGVIALTSNIKLFSLTLNQTKVTDRLIEHLAGPASEKLAILGLKGTKLTSASAPLFEKFSRLEELDVRDTGISDDDISYLPDALDSLRKLNKPGRFGD
jgi:Leucine-rich repeat (LRR) protein